MLTSGLVFEDFSIPLPRLHMQRVAEYLIRGQSVGPLSEFCAKFSFDCSISSVLAFAVA